MWFLGIFVGLNGGSNYVSYVMDGSDWQKLETPDQNLSGNVSANVKELGQVLGEKFSPAFWSDSFLAITIILIFCIMLLLIYATIVARGALTFSAAKIDEGKGCSFGNAWKFGHKFFWRRLSFSLIISAAIIVMVAVLASPVIVLAIFEYTIPAIIFGVLFGLVLIAILVYLALILPYAERILFLENKKTTESISAAIRLFNRNWTNIVIMYLILMAIGIGYAMAIAFVFVLLGLLAFGISALIYLISHSLAFIFGGTFLGIFLLCLVISGGAIQAFSWSVVTLTYKKISRSSS